MLLMRCRAVLFALTVALSAGPLLAADASTERVSRLFDLIGLNALIDTTRDNIADIATTSLPPGPLAQWWEEAAMQHFDGTQMKAQYAQITSENMSDADIEALITLYSSDFLLRVSGLETAQQTGFDDADAKRIGTRILAELREDNPERVARYEQMLTLMNTLDSAVLQTQKITFIMLRTLAINGANGQTPDDAAIMALLQEQEEKWRTDMTASFMITTAHIYEALDDAQFAAYVEVLEKPLVRRMYDLVGSAGDAILLQEFERFAETLARMARAQKL